MNIAFVNGFRLLCIIFAHAAQFASINFILFPIELIVNFMNFENTFIKLNLYGELYIINIWNNIHAVYI